MEPWDGPASIAFTDGIRIGAVLDRNGLRPSRYYVTKDDLVLASEVGVLDVPADRIQAKGRLQPGRMFLVDTEEGRIVADEEIKQQIATEQPYREWLDQAPRPPGRPARSARRCPRPTTTTLRPTAARLRLHLRGPAFHPDADGADGVEPIGSMGTDTPLAVLSDKPQLLYNYFKQLFAQVTNPPIDCIREEIITSTETALGSERNLLEPTPESCRLIEARNADPDQRGAGQAQAHQPARASNRPCCPSCFTAGRRRRGPGAGAGRTLPRRPTRPSPTAPTS